MEIEGWGTVKDNLEFKNFHRLLCERFGYVHDEKDWNRDQLSLIEWIEDKVNSISTIEFLDTQNHQYRIAIRQIMIRLTTLLDEDQFKDIESLVRAIGIEPMCEKCGAVENRCLGSLKEPCGRTGLPA